MTEISQLRSSIGVDYQATQSSGLDLNQEFTAYKAIVLAIRPRGACTT